MPDNFEPIAKGVYLEGLAVDYARGIVWYSDVIAGGLHGVRPDGSAVSFNEGRMWTGGIMLNEDGAVLSSGQGGIRWNHPESGGSGWLVREIAGKPLGGINEMVSDGHGGIFCGSVDLDRVIAGEPVGPASLYHIAADGTARVVADGLGFVNGMMLSADGKQLFCNETFDGTYVYDVSLDRDLSGRRRLLAKKDVDGMALDAEGNLWITGCRSGEITRMRPDGTLLGPAPTPASAITQVRFGGADMRDIWITTVAADAADTLAVGGAPSGPNSSLYRARGEAPGLPLAPARFKLS